LAKKVNHEQRKREIAEKAIRLFSQVGYDNVSLLMIAAATGISRTVIYRYFCSKREVMDAAICEVTSKISRRCQEVIGTRQRNAAKLEGVCHIVVEEMFAHKEFLIAVFDFVVGMVRTGADMNSSIKQFTSGTRSAIKLLTAHAIEKGEFPSTLIVDRISDAIYSQFESCAMRIVLGTETNAKAAKTRFSDIIRAISMWK